MDQLSSASSSLCSAIKNTTSWVMPIVRTASSQLTQASGLGATNTNKKEQQIMVTEIVYGLPPNSRKWIVIGGVMGAAAVAIGAYGAHVIYPRKDIPDSRKAVFETANKYHFIHSLALLAVPFARKSVIPGTLFLSGILIFSGTLYYHALTENMQVRHYTPYGGMALILAWLSMAL